MKAKGTLREYLEYHKLCEEKYEKSVVFMQVGMFYEIYRVEHDGIQEGPDIYEISDIMNIQVTRKSKKDPPSYSNQLMAGVPDHSYLKHRNTLLESGYTIMRVDQVSKGPNPEREIVETVSAGTVIDYDTVSDMNCLASLYIEMYPAPENQKIYCVGFSVIDIATGVNYVHFMRSTVHDPQSWSDEVYKLLHNYGPREILIHYKDKELSFDRMELCQRWNISHVTTHMNPIIASEFHKVSYQNEYYRKIYPHAGVLSSLEYLGFERTPEIVLSHMYMIEYIYQHKVENVRKIHLPIHHNPRDHLSLSYNCMYQLYLIDTKEHSSEQYSSLLSLLNKCKTAIGRRLCKSRLLNPILDPDILTKRYSEIKEFQREWEGKRLYETLSPMLSQITDLANGYRKMGVGILHPYEFVRIHQSYHYLLKVLSYILPVYPTYHETYEPMRLALMQYQDRYQALFDLGELEKHALSTMTTAVFKPGVSEDIDSVSETLRGYRELVEGFRCKLSSYIDRHKDNLVKLSHTDKDGYSLTLTKTRTNLLIKRLKNLPLHSNISIHTKEGSLSCDIPVSELIGSFKTRGDITSLRHPSIENLSHKLVALERELTIINKQKYTQIMETFSSEYKELFCQTVSCVGEIDLNVCIAKISSENVYCQPTIQDRGSQSYLEATQIRHPLVEKVQTNLEYVPNDISLHQDGILLYGTNACGKSTLMKSVGLALIMAQAGFFVPCSEFIYYPYTQVFTRILNNDNLFKGQSSFAIEMSELRNILKRADETSLVLGDELCSGTEHLSATCIVTAGLKQLSSLKSSFIFTSHLHQLMEIPVVQDIENLRIKHLEIHYDKVKDLLEYRRTLIDGSGPPVYGLEVCKAMDMGEEFMTLARQVQMYITGESSQLLAVEGNSYNPDIYKDMCGVCKATCDKYLEIHHIKPQKDANKDGIIGHHHKNNAHNLVPLCKDCHYKVTHENLVIHGYHMTTHGKQLRYEYLKDIPENNEKTKRKKFTAEQISTVMTYQDRLLDKSLTKTQCLKTLEIKHTLKMSSSTLTKIIEGTY